MTMTKDAYQTFGEIVAQVKAHLNFQKGLGIYSLLSQRQTKVPLTLGEIEREVADCTRCKLHKGRNNIVFGEGNPEAVLVFVGEAPGKEEDLQGRPFAGQAGGLLTRIIQSIELTREEVYIANIVKCRPPQNRDPEPDEIRTCLPFLIKQLEAIRPKIICALGTFAARTLLGSEDRISSLRGRFHTYQGARLMPTYHPAFLLRNPRFKKDVWEDMKMIREEYKKS